MHCYISKTTLTLAWVFVELCICWFLLILIKNHNTMFLILVCTDITFLLLNSMWTYFSLYLICVERIADILITFTYFSSLFSLKFVIILKWVLSPCNTKWEVIACLSRHLSISFLHFVCCWGSVRIKVRWNAYSLTNWWTFISWIDNFTELC